MRLAEGPWTRSPLKHRNDGDLQESQLYRLRAGQRSSAPFRDCRRIVHAAEYFTARPSRSSFGRGLSGQRLLGEARGLIGGQLQHVTGLGVFDVIPERSEVRLGGEASNEGRGEDAEHQHERLIATSTDGLGELSKEPGA